MPGHYLAMVQLSRRMLEAARQADWELLVDLGQQRDGVEAALRARGDGAAPAAGEQDKRMVQALLEANAQIKLLIDRHLAGLQSAADGGDGADPA